MPKSLDTFIQQLVSVAVATNRDIDPYGNSNNRGLWHIQYGFASIEVPSSLVTLLSRKEPMAPIGGSVLAADLIVSGRAEGDFSATEGFRGKRKRLHGPEKNTDDWWPKLLAWAVDILATGRTIECGQGVGLSKLQTDFPRHSSNLHHSLHRIHTLLEPEGELPLNMDPPYQRGHVWTDEQASAFMGYFLRTGGAHNPSIFINRREWVAMDESDEVIDGKQRLTAMRRWVDGKIPAKTFGHSDMWFQDTTECERRSLPAIQITYVELTPTQILMFYLVLNSGGTPHTPEEISQVKTQLAFALEIP